MGLETGRANTSVCENQLLAQIDTPEAEKEKEDANQARKAIPGSWTYILPVKIVAVSTLASACQLRPQMYVMRTG